ncbi:hypothetical protein TWF696_009694 [Orbilia brochopaga]|uniref:Uncharacterized protein n=1 Tax=Orbilia brochopaga TaxID=3140254 RepID=A0AAV9UCA2_9PEZI
MPPPSIDIAVAFPQTIPVVDLTLSPPPYNNTQMYTPPATPSHASTSTPPPPPPPSSTTTASPEPHSPDVLWLLHVKAAPRARPQPSAVTSLLPSSLRTSFFATPLMNAADLAALAGDMTLARRIAFLPYRSPDDCLAATYAFSRRRLQSHTNIHTNIHTPASTYRRYRPRDHHGRYTGGYGHTYGYRGNGGGGGKYGYGNMFQRDEIRAPLIPDEWYPGFWYYVKLRGDWIARHPAVRSVSGHTRFLSYRDDADCNW